MWGAIVLLSGRGCHVHVHRCWIELINGGKLQVTAQSAINKLLSHTLHYDVHFHLALSCVKVYYSTLNIIEWLLIIIKEKKDYELLTTNPWTDFMVSEIPDVSNRLMIGNPLG